MKKSNKSGTLTVAVERLEQDFEKYNFFKWYEEFIRSRMSKSNVLSPVSSEKEDLDEYDSLQESNIGEEGKEDQESPF